MSDGTSMIILLCVHDSLMVVSAANIGPIFELDKRKILFLHSTDIYLMNGILAR